MTHLASASENEPLFLQKGERKWKTSTILLDGQGEGQKLWSYGANNIH